ncbi:hypothetical protein NQ315_016505 [Exocentrus adspersus]|uniref:Reverse transcriptase domain-containing protein n=1 Tax=Exocentrus adspersus TaxID=1586481 RepID=A0AAV8VYE2_9CUCU|nr:hypothetical protein NQ315_016505 [Exocentrus adspersus]
MDKIPPEAVKMLGVCQPNILSTVQPYPEGIRTFGYADDLAVFAEAKFLDELQRDVNDTLRLVDEWMTANQLKIAPEKTEGIMVRGPKNIQVPIDVRVRDQRIEITKSIQYLGVILDWQICYGPHVDVEYEGGGTRSQKRQLLMTVVHSIMLYAAPIWADAVRIESYRKLLEATQRNGALRVACSYRTVSSAAVQFLSNHDSFKTYLKRIGKREDDRCQRCQEIDTTGHILFRCLNFQEERMITEARLRQRMTEDNIVQTLVETKET